MSPQPVRDLREPVASSDWKVTPMPFMVRVAARRIAVWEGEAGWINSMHLSLRISETFH